MDPPTRYEVHVTETPGSWSFTRWITEGQLEGLEIHHPDFHAKLLLQGAHLIQFAPTGEANWLWLSKAARFETGRAVRGGIPICWPWFGVPDRNPPQVREHIHTRQSHGFARTQLWQLDQLTESPETVEVSLALEIDDDMPTLWRGKARALLTFRFSADLLHIALTTTNLDNKPLALTQALHTYLPCDDVASTQLEGFDGVKFVDTLRDWELYEQCGPVTFDGEVDRIYQRPAEQQVCIHNGNRQQQITSLGSRSAVVWNPGPEKADCLSDFPAEAWRSMVCVETANALHDFRVLNSGQTHTLGAMISCRQGLASDS